MKYSSLILLLTAFLVASCQPKHEILIQVINLSDQPRNDASVLLTRGEISKWLDIPENTLPLLLDQNGKPLPCQVDDVDNDGSWDELFAPLDMAPAEQRKVKLGFTEETSYPMFKVRTNLRLGDASKPSYPELSYAPRLEGISYDNYEGVTGAAYQMEGPAWENDRVGFRNYLDQRNGMDIFGKLTSDMVLDDVGLPGESSYHEPGDWGMDVLKVGTSLGAGGIAYLYKDSLYRVGDNGSGSYEVIFEGSQRSRFNLEFSDWKVAGNPVNVIHQVEISAGKHYYQSTVTYQGPDLNMDLVAGIVNMKSHELKVLKLGEHHTALLTHDFQAEDSSMLAMVLMIPNDYLVRIGETKKQGEGITQTYYAVLDAHPGDMVPYRFYALWEREDSKWRSLDEVEAFLEEEAARWTQSVAYKILN